MEKITRYNYEAFFLDFIEGALSDERNLELKAFLAENPDLASELEEFESISLQPAVEKSLWNDLKIPTIADLIKDESLREQLYFKCMEAEANDYDQNLLAELLNQDSCKKEYEVWVKLRLTSSAEEVDREGLYKLPLEAPITSFNFEDFLIARTEGLLTKEENKELEKCAARISGGERELALADSLRLEAPKGVFYPFKDELKKKKKGLVLFYRAAAILLLFGLSASVFTILNRQGNIESKYAQREIVKSSPDSLENLKSEKEAIVDSIPNETEQYELEEWEVREPDPVFVADHSDVSPKENVEPKRIPVEKDFDEVEFAETKEVENLEVEEEELPDPVFEVSEEVEPVLAEQVAEATPIEYQTIGEIAENELAVQLNLSDEEKDELALSVAKRIAQKAGEALDSEVKKEVDEDGDRLTYSLRIRGFKVSHSTAK